MLAPLENVTSKTSSLKSLILKAYRKRWNDILWGIHVKDILPRGVCGDVHNLASCLFEFAFSARSPSIIVISYLKHSLCTHLVSHVAVLACITRYNSFHHIESIEEILRLLNFTLTGITCRTKQEESLIMSECLNLINWLLDCYKHILRNHQLAFKKTQDTEYAVRSNNLDLSNQLSQLLVDIICLLEKILKSEFLYSILCCARCHEGNETLYAVILNSCKEIKNEYCNGKSPCPKSLEKSLEKISSLEIIYEESLTQFNMEPMSYCLQSLIVRNFNNSITSNKMYISHLCLVQKMKNFSNAKLYCEVIRVCMVYLQDSIHTERELDSLTFMILKLPQIIKGFHIRNSFRKKKTHFYEDISGAFKSLCSYTVLLNKLDILFNEDCFRVLLKEFEKLELITNKQVDKICMTRECASSFLEASLSPKNILILNTKNSMSRILKTLNVEYTDSQVIELSRVIVQLLNNFDLVLTVINAEEKMKIFVSGLLKINQRSKESSDMPSESSNKCVELFEISFLMLLHIVQTYGSSVIVPKKNEEIFFFIRFMNELMPLKNNLKCPYGMTKDLDSAQIHRLYIQITSGQFLPLTSGNGNWYTTCQSAMGVVEMFLNAWNSENIETNELKEHLSNLRSSSLCLSIFASSWLCSHMSISNQLVKPMNMLTKLIEPIKNDPMEKKTQLATKIIKEFRCVALSSTPNIDENEPYQNQLRKILEVTFKKGWIEGQLIEKIQGLYSIGGSLNLCKNLTEDFMKINSLEDINKALDLSFAIFHIDIEKCTLDLLKEVLPQYLIEMVNGKVFTNLQVESLAKFCAHCVLSFVKFKSNEDSLNFGKRLREDDFETPELKIARIHGLANDDEIFKIPQALPRTSQKSSSVVNSSDLGNNLTDLFLMFNALIDDYGDKVKYFVLRFLQVVISCGRDNAQFVLDYMPETLTSNMIRALPQSFTSDLIFSLYNPRTEAGRKYIVRDLSLLQNIRLKGGNLI